MYDMISRKAAIEWFFRPYSNEESYSNLDIERALNAIPTVNAIPVEWLENHDSEDIRGSDGNSYGRRKITVVEALSMWQRNRRHKMAEYVEVMKQKKRMCNSTLCCKCDIFHLSGENIENCPQFISNNPSKAEKIIMQWAAEHPEPVYPTWIEWLMSEGVIPTNYMAANSTDSGVRAGTFYVTSKAFSPIPTDIAEKLEIDKK